ncbi:Uncharacterized protein APZ42_014923 [Daphnia magna]|uniref:Uncharacterized protein n=1 Tax=Daphnia magna TaxID=35525 RepID=A0A162P0V5_9CRUS|nr:Uncharacterized protein APZ42_014923 [Daphnia magna]
MEKDVTDRGLIRVLKKYISSCISFKLKHHQSFQCRFKLFILSLGYTVFKTSIMTTVYLTTGSELSMCGMNGAAAGANGERPKLQSCVSIVVDDVDGDCDNNGGSHYYSDSHHHHQFYIQHQTSSDGQESNEDEVRHRRDEFARLLDEHEQVVRELRRIESSGELQSLVETPSGGRTEEAPSLGLKQEE